VLGLDASASPGPPMPVWDTDRLVTYSRSVTVDLTYRCFARCGYCEYRSDEGGLISPAELKRLLELGEAESMPRGPGDGRGAAVGPSRHSPSPGGSLPAAGCRVRRAPGRGRRRRPRRPPHCGATSTPAGISTQAAPMTSHGPYGRPAERCKDRYEEGPGQSRRLEQARRDPGLGPRHAPQIDQGRGQPRGHGVVREGVARRTRC